MEVSILNSSASNEEKLILGDEMLSWYKWEESKSAAAVFLGVEEGRESVDASLRNEMNKKSYVSVKAQATQHCLEILTTHFSITKLSTAHLINSCLNCYCGSLSWNTGFCTETAEKALTQSIPLILVGGILKFCWHLGTKGQFSTVLGCCN